MLLNAAIPSTKPFDEKKNSEGSETDSEDIDAIAERAVKDSKREKTSYEIIDDTLMALM